MGTSILWEAAHLTLTLRFREREWHGPWYCANFPEAGPIKHQSVLGFVTPTMFSKANSRRAAPNSSAASVTVGERCSCTMRVPTMPNVQHGGLGQTANTASEFCCWR